MSMKILEKIDRYYLVLAVVVLILGGLILMTVMSVRSAIGTASEIDEDNIIEYSVEQQKLDEVYDLVTEKSIEPLDLGD